MDKFVVSARKYRPQNFSTVVGQAHITTTLKNAIKNNQLAHAFLFCGPRGVGKTTCARILAKTINCENQTKDGEACNVCNSCISFDAGTSLNIHELDAASNNSVDDIRSLVEQVRFAPQAGKYKVYIVDEVHMLSSSAFNAFLKTLEEPPPYAIFILATTEKHKILPTILSRCQIFDFKRITNNDTVEHLQEICDKESIKADKAALHVIAQKSEGCMRDSLSILDKIVSFTNGAVTYTNTLEHLNILDEDYYFKLLDYLQQQDLSSALLMYDEINRKGFEGDMVLDGFSEFLRNLLVSRDAKVAMLLEVAEDFKQKYLQTAQKIPAAFIISALNILNESELNYKQSRNKRLHVELTIIKLSYLQQALELVNNDGVVSKKKLIDGAKTIAFRALPIEKLKPSSVEKHGEQEAQLKQPVNRQPQAEAKLIIEEPSPVIKKSAHDTAPGNTSNATAATAAKPTLGSLSKIRQQIAQQNQNGSNEAVQITEDELYVCWGLFIEKLRNKSNFSAVTNFKAAELKVIDNNTIEIITQGEIHKAFIEVERADLVTHLQQHFNNRLLTYQVLVIEKEDTAVETDIPLTRKQQYLKIIEEYPLVKELKERLKLELD
ncbi:DNA polymerase III subunit gamma/tau [Ferruginibacter paludis]|uniref:DNA polymerase III subunit gamma/tau n=1 Tax=Ferruginibacter paludis TaxID=1310417 RepID=UPI0025B5D3F4|nr:DNA polymerase III subunit gamma/tau [Ferruginibacter paludis]MDN3657717.1 DNA polymerase III subunit gamma/tau [Ferruginibacter paludis]